MRARSVSGTYAFLLVVLLAVIFLVGCAIGPRIRSDYDPDVDFSRYKTFGFFSPLGIESPGQSTIGGAIFRDAIGQEMESRGYALSDAPDLLINVSGRLQEQARVATGSGLFPGGNYYGYRRGFYDPWHGYDWSSDTHVDSYTHGTLNVDIVDRVQKRMVWEGVAVGRVNQKKTNAEQRAAIHKGIEELFAGYPFRAGK